MSRLGSQKLSVLGEKTQQQNKKYLLNITACFFSPSKQAL